MSDELISIIMPAKNAEAYLEACLDSILAQTYSSYELIVVNDHSTDKTLDVLQHYANRFSSLLVLNNNGVGIISALQMGFSHAKGQYISRMDADDKMAPKKLELLHQALKNKPNGVATGLVEYFAEGGVGDGYLKYQNWLNSLCIRNDNFSEIYKECVIPSPCWMLERNTFERIGAFDYEVYPEDYELAFRMYANQLDVVGVNEVCHYWRDYPERTSRNDDHYADNNFLDLKLKSFLNIDREASRDLILWGAGKKGKYLAKQLSELNHSFGWICDNDKKIGKDIYGVKLESTENQVFDAQQVIVAVANEAEQSAIKISLKNAEAFFFC